MDSEVWRLALAEFKKPESKMEMEISLLLNYFGGQDSKDLALPPKQPVAPDCAQGLMDAFHAHMVAGIFWDFDTEERGELTSAYGIVGRTLAMMMLQRATCWCKMKWYESAFTGGDCLQALWNGYVRKVVEMYNIIHVMLYDLKLHVVCVRRCHHTEPFPNFSLPFQEMRTGPPGSVSLKKGALQRLLEVMKLDWALQSNSFQDMCRLSRTLA